MCSRRDREADAGRGFKRGRVVLQVDIDRIEAGSAVAIIAMFGVRNDRQQRGPARAA